MLHGHTSHGHGLPRDRRRSVSFSNDTVFHESRGLSSSLPELPTLYEENGRRGSRKHSQIQGSFDRHRHSVLIHREREAGLRRDKTKDFTFEFVYSKAVENAMDRSGYNVQVPTYITKAKSTGSLNIIQPDVPRLPQIYAEYLFMKNKQDACSSKDSSSVSGSELSETTITKLPPIENNSQTKDSRKHARDDMPRVHKKKRKPKAWNDLF